VFILDAQGGYAGELVLDEDCVVEFGDFLAAVPERGLEDRQSIFIGEYNKATALHGEGLSLIAISKGDVQPSEVTWGKIALTVAEAHLSGPVQGASAQGPDKGVLESLAGALEKREAEIAERERAFPEKEAVAAKAHEERGRALQAQVEDLTRRLADAEAQRAHSRQELERLASTPAAGAGLEAERRQLEKDKKAVQRQALQLLDREEKVRARESHLAEEAGKVDAARKENEALLATLETAKKPADGYDVESAKREMSMRVKILQQKALDLLDREEKLRKRQEEFEKAHQG